MGKATMRTGEMPEHANTTAVSVAGQLKEADHGSIKTDDGHALTLRSLSVVEEMRLLKMLGEYNSSYYAFCSQVARVASIDGNMVPVPNSEREIEAVAARIGKPGVAALMNAIISTTVNDEKEKDQVKNS